MWSEKGIQYQLSNSLEKGLAKRVGTPNKNSLNMP